MLLDFRNTNTLWASVAVETLSRLGLISAIICPGSRSTPLTVAFARHRKIKAIPILDERSAAFFALGIAKRTGLPVALVCTSGTAGANFYPAIIEAKESRVPLVVITADRPPELRHCHAGQTIDQVKLFGNYPNWQTELAVPDVDLGMLRYLRQTTIYAWERSRFPTPGVVHLNLPFRDPLAPTPQLNTEAPQALDWEDFFAFTSPSSIPLASLPIPQEWLSCKRGIIIAGIAHSHTPKEYCQAIAMLSQVLQYPVLAEALSPLRNYADLNPYLITTYDLIVRNEKLSRQLAPEIVVQLGELPTSKELRTWLETIQPHRWIVDPSAENFDSLHGKSVHLRVGVEQLENRFNCHLNSKDNSYLQQWCDEDLQVRQNIDQTMHSINTFLESKVAWLLSQTLPSNTPIFIANSMSVRNMEFFWMPGNSGITPYFNRGANGIDGTLSTALGIAYRDRSSILLTGDLALLHDTNGFLIQQNFVGHLTIILINNNGGGIFEMLPISQFEPPFEEFFATPQNIDFAKLCQTYNVEHKFISSWEQLKQLLNPLPETGIRVLEISCDRKADARWLQDRLKRFSIHP
ncbi:MAG: 2-succinyl-5-enolpyruvyl-6-hydroxy-3-cyclohexene-1-carboxylic-acid synthase [Hydrococcus sp. Prado102]|jgi:2-succinyl-5-enolpyruvyl-6-hydroxy-3-cyclohexene-1-carboxylate synthase|nr:2-succinyl-5-enolpyruvyl-6-hydroxy-3-cyclohexene-1-carboxylic-acid synthase [Hydrococcus sp. Prado102]